MKELKRLLSKLGVASRTRAEILIRSGRVSVNGQIIKDPDRSFRSDTSIIEIDHSKVEQPKFRAILFNKPKGVLTTRSDERGRKTIYDVLGSVANGLHAVGRLDQATTGLLLMTNDTLWSSFLTEPSNQVLREYIVTVRGELTSAIETALKHPITIDEVQYQFKSLNIMKSSGKESTFIVSLSEGKNRELRTVFKHFGREVTRLKRIKYGPYELGDLAPGSWIEINDLLVYRQTPTKD